MSAKWMSWSGWSVWLLMGLWLLMGQGAIAEPNAHENLTEDASEAGETPDSPATTVDEWRQQIAQADRIEITKVQFEATEVGLTLQLETNGKLATPETSVAGNAAIADIPNAVLRLPEGEDFFVDDPAAGIVRITVTSLADNQVRIAITGTESPPTVSLSSSATSLVLSATPAEPTAQDPDDSIEITVTAEKSDDEDYFVPNADAATRTNTPILEVPASLQVIPQKVLEDQQATDLDDALRNISGASVNSAEGRGFQVNLRGFEGSSVFRDGFRIYSPNDNGDAAGQGFPEIANVEQIEVLKGPASILFGQLEPGGAVNVVSKKPLDDPSYTVGLQAGSYGFLRPQIDLSGPLTEDKSLLYRLVAVYQREEGFRNFEEDMDRFFIAPTLTWRIGDRTDLNFQLEYLNDQRPLDPGLVALGNSVAAIPRDRILGEPNDTISSEFINVGYDLEHRFSENWTLRNRFRYLKDSDDIRATLSFPFIGGLNETTGELNRVFAEQEVTNKTLALQTNIVGKFSTGSIDHTLLLGVDLARYSLQSDSFTDFQLQTPINIFNPVYGAVPRPDRLAAPTSSESIDTDSLQFYLQDQIKLLDNLILVAGVNYEIVDQTTVTTRGGTTTDSALNADAFSPRVGMVYQPIETLSLYASYSRSFFPSAAVTVAGDPLEPEAGEGFEVGLKTELFDRRLLATLAYFNLTKRNVATADPTDPRFSVATGEQKSQGVELDVIGKILPGWNLIASYSFIDAEITQDNQFDIGNRLPGVPKHSTSLWTTYEIQSGDLAGLGFGVGFNWVGDRQGDLPNSFELDSYFLTNAAVFYKRNRWRLGLNFQNIFDVNYIEGTPRTRTRGIEPGEPFTVIGSISYEF